jgi:hypothetical protein
MANLAPADVPFITLMPSSAAEYARQTRPESCLTVLVDGMCTNRDGTTPLPVPPLSPPEMEPAMRQRANRRLPLRRF